MGNDTKLTDEDRHQLLSFGDYGEHAVACVDALTAENERLRETLDAEKHRTEEEAGCIAENERLRAEYEATVLRLHAEVRRCDAAEASLATATALLVQAKDRLMQAWLVDDIRSFLANQPAAPTKARASSGGPCPCGDQERPGHPVGWCGQDIWRSVPMRPAQPDTVGATRTEAFEAAARRVLAQYPAHSAMVARTEAEQAVLLACSLAPDDWLLWWCKTGGGAGPGSWMMGIGEAELARRGLK